MRFSAEDLVKPVSEDLPCGEDLEYDPAFQQMETMMQSTAEQEFGDTVIPGSGPDWKGVRKQADDLLGRTRDLRVLTCAALADLHLDGLAAFRNTVEALNACLEAHWDTIYPELDADDNNDPTMRYNTLMMLDDFDLVCTGLQNAPLVELKGVGAFSLRDIELSEGKIDRADDEEEVYDIALIQGAFGDAGVEELTALGESVGGSIEQLKHTSELWAQLAGNSQPLSVDQTLGVLGEIYQAISNYAPVAAAVAGGEEAADVAPQGGAEAAAPISGAINDRNDVIRAIDKICEYYKVHEPSSPIPLLLRRAQRLVAKSFYEILQDIVPASLEQVRMITGERESSE